MEVLPLTFLLVAGFVLASIWRVTNVLGLKEGQVIYFVSVVAAIPPYLLASSLLGFMSQLGWEDPVFAGLANRVLDDAGQWVGDAEIHALKLSVLALPVALGLGALLNLPFASNEVLTRYLFERFGDGEPLDSIFSEAASRQLPVLVTLNSSKVYLGYPLRTELYGASNAQWIHLAPWLSGYRNSTQELNFTTAYAPIAWSNDEGMQKHDPRFQVAIPLSSVASAAPFDLEIYQQHFQAGGSDIGASDKGAHHEWRTQGRQDLARYFLGCLFLFCAVLLPSTGYLLAAASGLAGAVLLYVSATRPAADA